MHHRQLTKCKGCGAPMFFHNGKPYYARKVPVILDNGAQGEIEGRGYVSHFINCTSSEAFTNKREKLSMIPPPETEGIND